MPNQQHIELFTADDACRVIIRNIAADRLTREEVKELERRLREKCQTKLSVKITLAPFSQKIADSEAMIYHCSGIMAITLPGALHLEPIIETTIGARLMETVWATLEKALKIADNVETALITGRHMLVVGVAKKRASVTRSFQPQPNHVN